MARPAPGQLSQHLPSPLGLWVPVSPASPTGPDLGWNPQAIHSPLSTMPIKGQDYQW